MAEPDSVTIVVPAFNEAGMVARVIRDQGKGAIYVASEVLEKKGT